MTVKAISVGNYRGFSNPVDLEIRPITILLGRNSSGKSSIVRLVPLIQQSLERQSSVPILWESDLVDLGGMSDVISRANPEGRLELGFTITTNKLELMQRRNSIFYYRMHADHTQPVDISYTMFLRNDDGRTRYEGFMVNVFGQSLNVLWNSDGIITEVTCDGHTIPIKELNYKVSMDTVFPEIIRTPTEDELKSRRHSRPFYPPLTSTLKSIFHGRTADEKVQTYSASLIYRPLEKFREDVLKLPHVVKKKIYPQNIELAHKYSFMNYLPIILFLLQQEVSACFQNSAYIGPARATTSRFDRIQELAVNRLASKGENTAMYLHSLSDSEKNTFNELMEIASGHYVDIEFLWPQSREHKSW